MLLKKATDPHDSRCGTDGGYKMEKKKNYAFGKNIYLLGKDKDGINYWLEEASFDCDWYYGFGYIETYTHNERPDIARDIQSHEHYDTKILKNGCSPDKFKEIFTDTPLNDDEIWKLNELMTTFYTMRHYMDLIYRGSSNITKNDSYAIIKNDDEWLQLKNKKMPALFAEIYKLLTPETKGGE